MSLPILLVSTFALIATVSAAAVSTESASVSDKPTETNVETFDSYSVQKLPEQMPINIQLPREDPAGTFLPPQPATFLKAPQFIPNPPPNFYQMPIPSEYLTAPTEGLWNPNDDPTLYYELPASITKETLPTNQFPKKFNKDIHSKNKPLSIIPKQEIALEPINELQLLQKQKELYKKFQSLNKLENQRQLEKEKVPKRSVKPRDKTEKSKKSHGDSVKAETIDHHHHHHHNNNNHHKNLHHEPKKYTKGRSSKNAGEAGSGQPERVLFHMAGHEGPMSYKWGYDTGKGQNRQFRFEERDREGVVKGQFGYYDSDGKLRMMNYSAHPQRGFQMEPAPESEAKVK